ncbi:hypothetical protein B0H15DRAFT_956765 [Mycena belliarum]|uniref:Proteophosphoglycan ppg4 n=1 Tax=Mycena belliarum TaxID=1033014 RepID=A0AAD6TTU7_9AGAR|nr:hypothetical protein B0H15DRAFT_956765 [Mycena belliae]
MLLPPRNLGTDPPPTSIQSSTWIPIAVVVGALCLLTLLVCTRRSLRNRIASMGNGVAVASGMPARELTAEQLAGSINRAPAARARRPRRTPSQISTVSLPAYMKEPGEQELVVSRGPDGEDVAMPTASAMDDDDDHSTEDQHGAAPARRSSAHGSAHYGAEPHPPTSSPLLGSDEHDPRGAAPAYFEVVDPEHYPPGIVRSASPEPQRDASPEPPQRRSGFFSLFRPAPPPPPPMPPADSSTSTLSLTHTLTHTRTHSTTAPSLALSRSLSPSHPAPPPSRHRASPSASTLFSLGRRRSATSLARDALTSPSAISLASISAPLPHTLLKTEFSALPRGGPTPEQLSLISGSKEGGLGRFGVPWGEAAVAYASASANASRVALGLEAEAEAPSYASASGSGSGLPMSGETGAADGVEGLPSTMRDAALSVPLPPSPTAASPASPPPALHPPRADSRASGLSVAQSFATAEEGADDDEEEEALRIHVQAPTDAIVTGARS